MSEFTVVVSVNSHGDRGMIPFWELILFPSGMMVPTILDLDKVFQDFPMILLSFWLYEFSNHVIGDSKWKIEWIFNLVGLHKGLALNPYLFIGFRRAVMTTLWRSVLVFAVCRWYCPSQRT